jgi:hypothetical protein
MRSATMRMATSVASVRFVDSLAVAGLSSEPTLRATAGSNRLTEQCQQQRPCEQNSPVSSHGTPFPSESGRGHHVPDLWIGAGQ